MLGQPASWQTVWSPSDFTSDWSAVYSGPILARVLIHSGLRSMGVWALRTSRRKSLRPPGVTDGSVGAWVTSVHATRAPRRCRGRLDRAATATRCRGTRTRALGVDLRGEGGTRVSLDGSPVPRCLETGGC